MKICKNCGESNAEHAAECGRCKIKGSWSLTIEEKAASEEEKKESKSVLCFNCGHQTPPHGEKCETCRFPIQKVGECEPKIALRTLQRSRISVRNLPIKVASN